MLINLKASSSSTNACVNYFYFAVEDAYLPLSEFISVAPRQLTKFGFDEIYMINLKRRPERRKRMVATLKDLGIAFKIVDAVDGR